MLKIRTKRYQFYKFFLNGEKFLDTALIRISPNKVTIDKIWID